MRVKLPPLSFGRNAIASFFIFILFISAYQSKAQCTTPGPGEVAVEIVMQSQSFGPEMSWTLLDSTSGTTIESVPSSFYPSNNTTFGPTYAPEHQLCVPGNETLQLDAFDTFGDGWNGGTFYMRYQSNQDTVFTYSLPSGLSSTVYFTVPIPSVDFDLCQGDTAPALVVSDTISSDTGQFVYSWEESIDDVNWSPATAWGGNIYNYQPLGSQTDTMFFRRLAVDTILNDSIYNNFVLRVPDSLLVDSATVDSAVCSGVDDGGATIHVSGGAPPYIYTWSDGGSGMTRTGLAPGPYKIVVTDQTGCADSIDIEIFEKDPLTASIVADSSIACYGDSSAILSANAMSSAPPYEYLWSTGDTTMTVDSLAPGSYWVRVTDTNSCVVSDTFNVVQPDSLYIDSVVVNSDVTCFGGNDGSVTVYFTGGTGGITYTFNSMTSSAVLTDPNALEVDQYQLTITDANGCDSENTVMVTINGVPRLNGGNIGE